MSFRVVIPARMASSRLPGKVLLDIAGKPMLQHVLERARESDAEQVWVATDDARVHEVVSAWPADVALTSADHPSGSDRIRELADAQQWSADCIIVNVQGDEPLIPASLINAVARRLSQGDADWATVATPIHKASEYFDPNAVKVVLDNAGRALYFSRAPIPWDRTRSPNRELPADAPVLRHIGLYAYKVGALRSYCEQAQSRLERSESLEQLRALSLGMKIEVEVCPEPPPAGVDTPEDLERLRQLFDA